MRLLLLLSGLLCLVFSFGQSAPPPAGEVEAVVKTDMGEFRIELAPDKAPKHVAQFLRWVAEGYYDGSAFHSAVPNGIIQGGDPLLKEPDTPRELWGTGGLELQESEFSDLLHDRGVVSAVRIADKPDSDGSQFFVCVTPQPALDGKYSAFGRVIEGMDVVEKISQGERDERGLLVNPVRITAITLEKKPVEPFVNASADEMRKTVTLETTLGTLKLKMEPDWALNHVRNFLKLAATGWYDGTEFHRIVKGFVVQGGMAEGRSGSPNHPADRWVRPLPGEFRDDIKHVRGTVSMARTSDPDSATTSFFLMLGDAPHLDGEYSAFGVVVEGDEVLERFEQEEIEEETPKRRLELIKASIDPE